MIKALVYFLMFGFCFYLGYQKGLKDAYRMQEALRNLAVRSNESGVQVQDEVQDV